MTDPHRIDPERLAALLDGRLSDAEAAEVRRQLAAADDDTLSAYADAAAVAGELAGESVGESTGKSDVVPIRSAPSARRRWLIPAAAAAAAAIAAIIVWRPARPSNEYPPSSFAEAVPTGARAPDDPVWGRTRGAGDGIQDRARAARIGALLTDLDVDALRGDSTQQHAEALVRLIQGTLGGASVAAQLSPDSLAHLSRQTIERVRGQATALIGDSAAVAAGAYLEAARIATGAGDVTFFDKRPPTPVSALMRDQTSLDPSAKDALVVFDSLAQTRPRDAARLSEAVQRLLRALTQ